MTFLAPGRLALLLVVAALAVVYAVLQRRRRHYAVRFTNLELLAALAPRRPGWRRHVAAGALLGALAMLVVGFARPTRAVRVPRNEATVMLAIDVSASMEATDVLPNRLAAAQQSATDFAQHLPDRFRLGLVAFDGVARVLVPPTSDHEAVVGAISRLRLGPRTAAGEGVYAALEAIAGATSSPARGFAAPGSPAPGDAPARPTARIVLMSDGATTAGRPTSEAALAARDAGVPVSTIAFGTDSGTVVIGSTVIPVPVDRPALQQLADLSGGRFFQAASGEELSGVYRDIGTAIGYRTARREVTATFTGLALVLAGAGVVAGMAWGGRVL
jgi:Ca-activated chloride channel family protein